MHSCSRSFSSTVPPRPTAPVIRVPASAQPLVPSPDATVNALPRGSGSTLRLGLGLGLVHGLGLVGRS